MTDYPRRESVGATDQERRQQEYDESYAAQRRAVADADFLASLRERLERLRQSKPVADHR